MTAQACKDLQANTAWSTECTARTAIIVDRLRVQMTPDVRRTWTCDFRSTAFGAILPPMMLLVWKLPGDQILTAMIADSATSCAGSQPVTEARA